MNDLLNEYPVVIELPVAWGEMDAFQHVNNIVYFRYFESARLAYFHKTGYNDYMRDTGRGPILASTKCKFLFPLTYPDRVSVGARVLTLNEDRFLMEYCVASHNLGKPAAVGEGLVVSYDYRENRKIPLPDEIKQAITDLEKLSVRAEDNL